MQIFKYLTILGSLIIVNCIAMDKEIIAFNQQDAQCTVASELRESEQEKSKRLLSELKTILTDTEVNINNLILTLEAIDKHGYYEIKTGSDTCRFFRGVLRLIKPEHELCRSNDKVKKIIEGIFDYFEEYDPEESED